LANAKEYSDAIEFSDWLPVNESALIKPLIEIDIKRSNIITQLLIIAAPVAIIMLSFNLFTEPEPNNLALLYFLPLSFL